METWGRLKNIGLDWPLNYDVMAIWLRYFLSQNALKELYRRLIVLKMLQRSEIMPISDSVCTQCLLATEALSESIVVAMMPSVVRRILL